MRKIPKRLDQRMMLPPIKREPTPGSFDFVLKGTRMEEVDTSFHMDDVLQRITYAQNPQERLESLEILRQVLSSTSPNDPSNKFDSLVGTKNAVDRLLAWQLTCQLQIEHGQDLSTYQKVVATILSCLEIWWTRATVERRRQSILGVVEVLPWLVHAWRRFPHDDKLVRSVVQILRSWAKVKEARDLKRRLIGSGVIQLIRAFLQTPYKQSASPSLPPHSEVLALNTSIVPANGNRAASRSSLLDVVIVELIKDLTFRTDNDQKQALYEGLADVLLPYCLEASSSSMAVREVATATFWLWAACDDTGRIMVENAFAWRTWEQLWVQSLPPPHQGQNSSIEPVKLIRRNISSIVGTMVALCTMVPEPPVALLEQEWLVPTFIEVLRTESDVDLRRRCMRTVRCLASCSWGRSFLTQQLPDHSVSEWVQVLVRVLNNHRVDGADTGVQVCQTLTAFLPGQASMSAWMPLAPLLETSLLKTVGDDRVEDKLIFGAAQALRVVLQHSSWSRGGGGRSCGWYSTAFFERLRSILQSHVDDVDYHVEWAQLIHQIMESHITSRRQTYVDEDEENDKIQKSRDGEKLLSIVCTPLLDILVTLLQSTSGPVFEPSRKKTMETLMLLIEYEVIKKPLVAHEGLLTALVNVCLFSSSSSSAGSVKGDAKAVLLELVPKL